MRKNYSFDYMDLCQQSDVFVFCFVFFFFFLFFSFFFWLLILRFLSLSLSFFFFLGSIWGIPRWCNSKESTCQCRRYKRHKLQSLGQEDPLEKEMANQSGILTWKVPWTEEPGGLHEVTKSHTGLRTA